MSVYANWAEFSIPGTYTVTVPKETKQIKVYLVGAGGGGGGGGGGQFNNWNKKRVNNNSGGGGGSGGAGEIGFFVKGFNDTSNDKNVSITVGSGGTAGGGGEKASSGNRTSGNKSGRSGGSGNTGNKTSCKIENDTPFDVKSGNGGTAGNGALFERGGNNGTAGVGGTGGFPGNPGKDRERGVYVNPTSAISFSGGLTGTIANAGIYPSNNPGQSGDGGQGGNDKNAGIAGRNGNNGYARIYFL